MKSLLKSPVRNAALGMALAALAGSGQTAPLPAWDGSLPAAGNPLTSQVYQDFTIYSLNYLSNLATTNVLPANLLPRMSYNVDSSPGSLHPEIVVITGNSGEVQNNLDTCGGTAAASGCDNAYNYNDATQTDSSLFRSSLSPDPSVVVTGETARPTWTATAAALKSFLAGNDLVFMFNLNESNGGDANTLVGQSLLVSMRVQLTDANGGVLSSFYVGANNAIPGLANMAAPAWTAYGEPNPVTAPTTVVDTKLLNPTSTAGWISTDPRWAYVHGAISVDDTTGVFLAMGDCVYTGLANCKTINQNLGANQVAFSAYSQELADMIVNDSRVAFMNVDTLTSGQSNGFEQLFIMGVNVPQVPEPGSLALSGLALAAACLAGARRRRNTTKL